EDDHPRRAAALPAGRRRRGARRPRHRRRGPGQRGADDRDRPARRRRMTIRADVVVIGVGVAGLAAALAAQRAGRSVVVLSRTALARGATATYYAQGGVAVVLPDTDDSVEAHVADTVAAGGGLCDVDAVTSIVADGYRAIRDLCAAGARFDTGADGH